LSSQAGLKIPQDISISGFDDLPLPEYINPVKPNLTTVHVDLEELGKIALNVLLEVIENPTDIAHRHTIPVKLKIGGTTLLPR
jgi:DNA-binding LacI/PurR family transcriptional regulator